MVLTLSDGTKLDLVGPIRRTRQKDKSGCAPIIADLNATADRMAAERKAKGQPVLVELQGLDEDIAELFGGDTE